MSEEVVVSFKEKMKGKEVEKEEASLDHSLDLRLDLNDMIHEVDDDESNMELNLMGPKGSSQKSQAAKKLYLCKYCNKKFSNSQALGGHQNAHKRERASLKKDNLVTLDQVSNPFYSNHHHGHHGSFDRSPLAVNMHSMILKPYHQYHHHHPFAHHVINRPQFPFPMHRADNYWVTNSGLQAPLQHVGINSSLLPNSEATAARNKIALSGQANFRGAAAAGFSGNHQQCEPTATGPNLSLKL